MGDAAGGVEIQLHRLLPDGFLAQFAGRLRPAAAGIVHQDVAAAEAAQHGVADARRGGGVGDVLDDDQRVGAGGQFGGQGVQQRAAAGEDGQPAALGRQHGGDGAAEPGRGAGDQGDLAGQLHVHRSVLRAVPPSLRLGRAKEKPPRVAPGRPSARTEREGVSR